MKGDLESLALLPLPFYIINMGDNEIVKIINLSA